MKFGIGSLEFNINRRANRYNDELTLEDIKCINDDHVEYLRSLSVSELISRVNAVTLDNASDYEFARNCLMRDGIIVVPDFVGVDVIDKCNAIDSKLSRYVSDFVNTGKRLVENENFLIQKGLQKLKSYSELASYDKTVVLVREGQDQGMIDIFNIEYAFPDACLLRKAYEDSNIKEIISPSEFSISFKNLNLYINSGVTLTRGFHVDSYANQFKAFIYLTDVTCLDDGPYTYVKGSQKNSSYRKLNQEISRGLPSKTEAPIVNRDNIIPVLSSRGGLVISDQSGFHRGFPQNESNKRVISVMNMKLGKL